MSLFFPPITVISVDTPGPPCEPSNKLHPIMDTHTQLCCFSRPVPDIATGFTRAPSGDTSGRPDTISSGRDRAAGPPLSPGSSLPSELLSFQRRWFVADQWGSVPWVECSWNPTLPPGPGLRQQHFPRIVGSLSSAVCSIQHSFSPFLCLSFLPFSMSTCRIHSCCLPVTGGNNQPRPASMLLGVWCSWGCRAWLASLCVFVCVCFLLSGCFVH